MTMKLIVKTILNGLVLIPFLYLTTNASVFEIVMSALGLCLLAFFIGDQWILQETNNTVATIADAGLAGLYLWALSVMLNWGLSTGELLVGVALLGVVEWLYHRMLYRWDPNRTAF
jgi:membrane protein HdeD